MVPFRNSTSRANHISCRRVTLEDLRGLGGTHQVGKGDTCPGRGLASALSTKEKKKALVVYMLKDGTTWSLG
jgi:hypothetical protein